MNARRPSIGVDFHVWDGIFQGSRSHLLGLYSAAIRQAPDLDFVFFLDRTESLRQAHPVFGSPNVRLVRMAPRPGLWRLGVQLGWLRWRHGVDLLHMQYRLPLLPMGPCACTIHDLLFETHPEYFSPSFVWQAKLSFRAAARNAAVLFSVSEFSKSELVRLYGVPAPSVGVTVNGVDREVFHPGEAGRETVQDLGLQPGAYLLTVGRLEPRKNHATLLRAYARLGPEAPPLVIVGQRDFGYDEVFSLIESLGLRERVRLLERVGDGVLPALMRHARLFAFPAFAEGFGMPVAEAMASGVPVVTSNTTSLPEVAGDAALLVDPRDDAILAAALRRLLEDPALAAALAARALERVRRFDWEVSAEVLLKGLREGLRAQGRLA